MFPVAFWKRSGFDPGTLALSRWNRGSYTTAPWAGTASAGASGGRTATTTGIDPTAGTALNGFTPALFDRASSQSLLTGVANNTIFSTGAGSVFVLFKSASFAQAPSGAAYGDGNFLTDLTNAETTFGFTTSGICAAIYDGAYQRVDVACTTATWHLAQFKYDSTNLKARVDSGAWSSVACGAYAPVTPSNPRIGLGYAIGYFDGSIMELGTAAYAISDADFDNIKSYVNSRYGLAL